MTRRVAPIAVAAIVIMAGVLRSLYAPPPASPFGIIVWVIDAALALRRRAT